MIESNLKNACLEIRLNRPEKSNAISTTMFNEMREIIFNSDAKAIVFTGSGKNFCAGADLNEMKALNSEKAIKQYTECLEGFFKTLGTTLKPVIVECSGYTCGAGVGICAAADFVIADEGSYFACPEIKSAITPSIITPYLIRKIGIGRTREMVLTGKFYRKAWGLETGLINYEFDYKDYIESLDLEAFSRIKKMLLNNEFGASGLATTLMSRL